MLFDVGFLRLGAGILFDEMGGIMKSYRDLVVWQEGIDLVTNIYTLSRDFPAEEKFALCNQMQRAAVSIPSNIAEGHTRSSRKEFLQFCRSRWGLWPSWKHT